MSFLRKPRPEADRVTAAEIVLPSGLRIPKGQRVRRGNHLEADGKPRYRVIGAIHFLGTNSPFLHDAATSGIWVEEHQTTLKEAHHA